MSRPHVRMTLLPVVLLIDLLLLLAAYRWDLLGSLGEGPRLASCINLGLPGRLCGALAVNGASTSLAVSAAIATVLVALGIYDPRPILGRMARSRGTWLLLASNAAGVAALLAPYLLRTLGLAAVSIAPWTGWLLTLGVVLLLTSLLSAVREADDGTLAWPPTGRATGWQGSGWQEFLAGAAILLLPLVAMEAQSLAWAESALQVPTFWTVKLMLSALGEPVIADPVRAWLGIGRFKVYVAASCSGLSGVVLVSLVMTGYVLALRRRLWLHRAIWLIPLAAAASWLLNALRLSGLLLIGAHVSPSLALDSFHSHAGWIAFCALSAVLLVSAENVRWFHRPDNDPSHGGASLARPLLCDPVIAEIAPFVVLLASLLIAGAAFSHPEAGYPLRAALMLAAVLVVRRGYRFDGAGPGTQRGLPRGQQGSVSIWLLSIAAGIAIAGVWIAVKSGRTSLPLADIVGPIGTGASAVWIAIRLVGTIALVPLIEEQFFRGYLMRRLDFGGLAGMLVALAASSALFGALHSDVWLAAGSGVVLGLVRWHTSSLAAAITAHGLANAIIAGWALWSGDWSLI